MSAIEVELPKCRQFSPRKAQYLMESICFSVILRTKCVGIECGFALQSAPVTHSGRHKIGMKSGAVQ